MNEAQTRLDLIDPALAAAGWTAANGCRVLVEQSACEFAPGRVGSVRGKPLKADEAQSFYKFVFDNYVQGGVDVFTRDNALSRLIITKYGTINDGKARLGGAKAIQLGFATLQKEVYAA